MSGINELLKDDSPESFADEEMGTLGAAVNRLIDKQREIEDFEYKLKQLKAEERKMSQEEIPSLMDNLGFEKITLKDGRFVSVKDAVQASIPVDKRPAAYRWMDEHGHGDLIKIALGLRFARGEKESAVSVFDSLQNQGLSPTMNESVHAGTLKAWAREELAQGRSLPESLFKIHVVRQTTVK